MWFMSYCVVLKVTQNFFPVIFSKEMQMYSAKLSCIALLLLVSSSLQAQIAFTATDSAAGPASLRPLSDAKAAQFDAAASLLGTVNLITFEGVALGNISNTTVASGVTINGVNNGGTPLTVNNTPNFPSNPELDGYNTTSGGAKYVEMTGGALVFTFASPIQAFGAYITGPQPIFFIDTITFNDGTSQSITVPAATQALGGVSFAGFTDAGKFISQVTINASLPRTSGDFIGVDDVRFVLSPVSSVPEPGALAMLLGIGVPGGLYAASRLRRRINSK